MGIDFSPSAWNAVTKTYEAWWAGNLDRPVLPIWLEGRDPGRNCPDAPWLTQANCADLSIPAADLIDRMDYELSRYYYLGDAFPMIRFDSFGPGLAAAFLGARLDNSTGRVWFHPKEELPIAEIHPVYDPDNIWLQRIRDIYAAGLARWGDQVLMSLPDIGGSLDVLSTFRPGEALLLDLYDDPDEVIRLNWECHSLWHRFFAELSAELHPAGTRTDPAGAQTAPTGTQTAPIGAGLGYRPGWTDWSGTYSAAPAYILQCDFCYMISPDMFDTFVLPELSASAKRLGRSVYHLDGIGQLPHLDRILQVPEIQAIQWVPGDGKPPQHEWPEVYRKIHDAGKGKVVYCGFDGMMQIAKELGTTRGLAHMPMTVEAARGTEARGWLHDIGY